MDKKKKTVATASTIIITATLAMFGLNNTKTIDGTYNISKVDKYKSEFSVTVPESLSADIFELYVNNSFVDKALLPKDKIITVPIVLTNPELLEVRIYKLKKLIGVGKLKDGKLNISVKDGFLKWKTFF